MAVRLEEHQETYEEFHELVNMPPKSLEYWLATEQSKSVGYKEDSNESVGHQSGRHILRILDKNKADLNKDDYAHMAKVVGYIKRHSAQRPKGDISETPWCYSLKNWGHDPTKK